MPAFIVTLFLCANCAVTVLGRGSYTNFVNQEKLYTLEDELITLSDVIINLEKVVHGSDDVHGIYDITSIIEKTKDIHLEVVMGRNLTSYVSHPINIYHMTKRLTNDWTDAVKKLQDSRSCAKEMQVKIQNIEDNLPNKDKLAMVRSSILNIQDIHGIAAASIVNWNINGSLPLSPLSIDEAFDFASAAYELKMYHLSLGWLEYVLANLDEKQTELNKKSVLSLMSSSNFMMDRPREALVNLDKILKIDPDYTAAKRNKKYIEERMEDGREDSSIKPVERKSRRDRNTARLCGNLVKANVTKQSRLFCTYTGARGAGLFSKPSIQTEVLSVKPTILLFHNLTTTSEQKAIQYLGYERMRDQLSKHLYRFPDGLESTWVLDTTRWQWIPKLQKSLETIAITNLYPDPSVFTVKNIGMDGYQIPKVSNREEYHLGTFLIFLDSVKYEGGEIVFPKAEVKVTPSKGSILFFDARAQWHASICPVLGEAEWIGMYPLMDKMAKDVCHKEKVLRPKFR